MEYRSGKEKLGFPDHFKFGIEIEANNTNTKELYESEKSKKLYEEINWKPDTVETLSRQGGAECVSGILKDDEKTWENLEKICNHMKKYPGKNGNEVVADEKCGCHVHFDATELLDNQDMMRNFLNLWVDSEELIYKMCNEKNDPLRRGAINQDLKPSFNFGKPTLKNILTLQHFRELSKFPWKIFNNAVHVFIERRKGFASPTSQKILKDIEQDKLKVSYKKGFFTDLAVKTKANPHRYEGLNLTNLGSKSKNTIEFRMSNGSVDPETIKKNVYLYGSLLNTAREMTLNPEYKKDEIVSLQKTDCTEEEKVDRLLSVLFDKKEDKDIYKDRWESVKDAPVFSKNAKKGFADRFQRNDIQIVTEKSRFSKLQEAMISIKDKVKAKNKTKDENDIGVEYGD